MRFTYDLRHTQSNYRAERGATGFQQTTDTKKILKKHVTFVEEGVKSNDRKPTKDHTLFKYPSFNLLFKWFFTPQINFTTLI